MPFPTADQLADPEFREMLFRACESSPLPRSRLLDFLSAAHAAAGKGVQELTDCERMGLCIAAGVPFEMAQEGDRLVMRTREPVTIAKYGERFTVHVQARR